MPEEGTYAEASEVHHHTKPHTSASACESHPPHLPIATMHPPSTAQHRPRSTPVATVMGDAHDHVTSMAWDRPCDPRARNAALYYLRGDHLPPSPTADAAAEVQCLALSTYEGSRLARRAA